MGTRTRWRRLDPDRAGDLVDARLELHWAAQIASAAGATHAPARDDFDHTSLGWSAAHHALLGRSIGDDLRAGLRPTDLTLLVVGPHDEELDAQPLNGRTLAQGLRWLEGSLARHSSGSLTGPLVRPAHPLPAHPTGEGAAFTGEGGALSSLADWIADAHALLSPIAERQPRASEVRCWPHHFDVATLVLLDAPDRPGLRSVGLGMTPGDDDYPTPYFYATPWPTPSHPSFPELPGGGAWHVDGWTGAVLVGTALPTEPEAQRAQAEIFLDAAFAACQGLLSENR